MAGLACQDTRYKGPRLPDCAPEQYNNPSTDQPTVSYQRKVTLSCGTRLVSGITRRKDPLTRSPVVRTQGHPRMPRRMQHDHSHQLTLFVSTIQDVSFGVGVAWREQGMWKMRVSSRGKHITTVDAALFATDMVTKKLVSHSRKQITAPQRS